MLAAERHQHLLRQVRAQGTANVSELAGQLNVSLSTVRRDLQQLHDRGLLARVHGGASVVDTSVEEGRGRRVTEHQAEKRRIGAAAAARVRDGSTVLISGGTTTETMLDHLAERSVTVVTNSISVAYQLSAYPSIPVVVPGGVLRHNEMSLLGAHLRTIVNDYHIDTAFTGAFAVDADFGLFGTDLREVHTDREMLKAAAELVVLADGSKFTRHGPVKLVPVDDISCLITDASAPEDQLDLLRKRGIDVVVV
ncbi:MAG: DeoR/GlpR family DNA-binding transcription regulator [Actinobacteria bacterium]|nr:DeoR/GlpR family DNA-binding transcription regulator [Actinomycetota bacterium]